MKVYMIESQAAANYTRDIHTIQEVPDAEAKRMIEAEICTEHKEGKDVEKDYKIKLKEVNLQLQTAFEENEILKEALENAEHDIRPYERKIKSLIDELKKAKGKKTKAKKRAKRN